MHNHEDSLSGGAVVINPDQQRLIRTQLNGGTCLMSVPDVTSLLEGPEGLSQHCQILWRVESTGDRTDTNKRFQRCDVGGQVVMPYIMATRTNRYPDRISDAFIVISWSPPEIFASVGLYS
jgi:hypothetical protein